MLRERYDQYFGPDYWPTKIYARSTEVPRTQLSLQLVLAGLFPPSERQTWNPHLPWIPTWTFFVPYKTDNLLFPHYCYRWVTLQRIGRKDNRIDDSQIFFLQSPFIDLLLWRLRYLCLPSLYLVFNLFCLYIARWNIRKEKKKKFNYFCILFCACACFIQKTLITSFYDYSQFLCFRYVEEYQRFLQLNNVKEMVNKYKNVMDYLTDHTGKLINNTEAITHIYNLLKEEVSNYSDNDKSKVFVSELSSYNYIQAAQNLTLPRWTQNVFPSPLKEIIELDFKLQSYTKTLRRLNGGWYC